MTVNDVESICRLTIELTKLRQNEVKHLCIENFAPELFGKLIREFRVAEGDICPTTGHPHRMPEGQPCLYCAPSREAKP